MTARVLAIAAVASTLGLSALPALAEPTGAPASSQRGGGCDDWGCGTNGPSVDGVVAGEVARLQPPVATTERLAGNGPSLGGVVAEAMRTSGEVLVPSDDRDPKGR